MRDSESEETCGGNVGGRRGPPAWESRAGKAGCPALSPFSNTAQLLTKATSGSVWPPQRSFAKICSVGRATQTLCLPLLQRWPLFFLNMLSLEQGWACCWAFELIFTFVEGVSTITGERRYPLKRAHTF